MQYSDMVHVHTGSLLADFSALKIVAMRCSEMSVHTRSTRRHIPEDDILPSKTYLKVCYVTQCAFLNLIKSLFTLHCMFRPILIIRCLKLLVKTAVLLFCTDT
jgi:hypothetical protein